MAENTSICINGELRPGDLILSTPADDYACLVGRVLSINKVGSSEHARETNNDTDAVHVNFVEAEYSEGRLQEIEQMLGDLYGRPTTPGVWPLDIDDIIMSPDALIRITGIGDDTLRAILDSREAAEALCKLVEIELGVVHDTRFDEQEDDFTGTPAQAALHEPDAFNDERTGALREQLIDRLNANLTEYVYSLYEFCEVEVIGTSSEIAAMAGAHYYLTEIHNFHTSEPEYLLKFQNPLQVVADQFELESEIEDHSAVMWNIFDKQDALQGDYELMPADPGAETKRDVTEKPSVMEQIRQARQESKTNSAPRKESHGKDAGPEL